MRLSFVYLFITCCIFHGYGQNFNRIESIPILNNGIELSLPFVGGLIAPQFSNIDLNNDGLQDLFIFDRNSHSVTTLIKINGSGNFDYKHDSSYEEMFPALTQWALLFDYNKDGIPDIFTSSSVHPQCCIEVWRGTRSNGRLIFTRQTFSKGLPDILNFYVNGSGFVNIYVSNIDLPALADIDSDGDMDIISFEADGSWASYYRNTSVEEGKPLDSLQFDREDICWGKFSENTFNETISLGDIDACAFPAFQHNQGLRHSGSSLCVADMDGDDDFDLILGDLGSNSLKMLWNGGNKDAALITAFDNDFPADLPAEIHIFLSAYHVDVDADGDKDLIVVPNDRSSGLNIDHIWLYENTSTGKDVKLEFRTKDFLLENIFTVYSGSHPLFIDENADGLIDILVGSNGITNPDGTKKYFLYLFRNIGTKMSPKYSIEDSDYLSLSELGSLTGRFAPAAGDMDGDGDLDLCIGDSRGSLIFLKNVAGKSKPLAFEAPEYGFGSLFFGQNARPQIFDVDSDGLNDLVVGKKNLQFHFLKNIGTETNPIFDTNLSSLPNSNSFGQIFNVSNTFGLENSAPFYFTSENQDYIAIGNESGHIRLFSDIRNHIYSGQFSNVETPLAQINVGRAATCTLADIDADGYLEIAIGNERGGIVFYNTIFKADSLSSTFDDTHMNVKLLPNPAIDEVKVIGDDVFAIQIFHLDGALALESKEKTIDVSALPTAQYIVKIYTSRKPLIIKLIKL
ncbi:MAG: T9SS type A sorting domain-containing protein [Saprospiraceae bacterium]